MIEDEVNLLPARLLERLEKQRLFRGWLRFFGASLFVAICIIIFANMQSSKSNGQILALQKETARPKELIAENRRLRSQLIREKDHLEKVNSLSTQHSPLVLMSLICSAKSEVGGQLELKHFLQLSNENPEDPIEGSVNLTMITSNAANSAKIVKVFEDSGYFKEVKLKGALEKTQAMHDDLRFTLFCRY